MKEKLKAFWNKYGKSISFIYYEVLDRFCHWIFISFLMIFPLSSFGVSFGVITGIDLQNILGRSGWIIEVPGESLAYQQYFAISFYAWWLTSAFVLAYELLKIIWDYMIVLRDKWREKRNAYWRSKKIAQEAHP